MSIMKLENIKEVCVKCGAKCCYLGGPTLTRKERNKILKAGFKDFFILSGSFYDVKTKNKCPYLENKTCSIYEFRPLVCKIWPVFPIFEKNKSKIIVLYCQLTRTLSKKDIEKLKNSSKKVSRNLSIANVSNLSPAIKRKLNKFGWNKNVKEALK
ncbi:hypothetical protein A3K64_01320 [Candidatus Micrarchaeota archaeon RBG_16_36_9]|nr:MAG: hypothetical protein A3K64_01320 [Candidatus Micrarchaeota archaeon RBG_16_36_9]